jgi:dihydroorotase
MTTLIKNITIVNEGTTFVGNILIVNDTIARVTTNEIPDVADIVIDGSGKLLFPGIIDTHVHFRDPGLTHKGDMESESAAAIAGGVTSFMEMPNTSPQTTNIEAWEAKMSRAESVSHANYAFWLGATNDNIETLLNADYSKICGIKLFMGSSTGNMLVDNDTSLERLFDNAPAIIAAHCEDEETIRNNSSKANEQWGDNVPWQEHANIRSREACYKSAAKAVELARRFNTKFHLCHISTAEEIELLSADNITGEVSPNHLTFNNNMYAQKGALMKCNPSIKEEADRLALLKAVADRRIATIATDHAPHTLEEKQGTYFKAPSGMPSIQHSLVATLEFVTSGALTYETVADAMCHAPSRIFDIDKRGYVREGFKADLVIVEKLDTPQYVRNIYKCGWNPMDDMAFSHRVCTTLLNGRVAYDNGTVNKEIKGEPLTFRR